MATWQITTKNTFIRASMFEDDAVAFARQASDPTHNACFFRPSEQGSDPDEDFVVGDENDKQETQSYSTFEGESIEEQCSQYNDAMHTPSTLLNVSDAVSLSTDSFSFVQDEQEAEVCDFGRGLATFQIAHAIHSNTHVFHPTTSIGLDADFAFQMRPSGCGSGDALACASGSEASTGAGVGVPQMWQAKTSVMLRNIPYTCDKPQIEDVLENGGFGASWDYLHIPWDGRTGNNKGYAFINFHNSVIAYKFMCAFNYRTGVFGAASRKPLEVSLAHLQGYADNSSRHRTSRRTFAFSSSQATTVVSKPKRIQQTRVRDALPVQGVGEPISARRLLQILDDKLS